MDYNYSWSSPALGFCESILRPGYPEYFNLVTATIMLWGGLYGLIRVNRLAAKLDSRQSASFMSLRLVYGTIFANGIGSVAYHSKAWQGFRLMDDFSLVIGIYVALGLTFENLMGILSGDAARLREAAKRELGIGSSLDEGRAIIFDSPPLPISLELNTKKAGSPHTRSRSEPGSSVGHLSLSIEPLITPPQDTPVNAPERPLSLNRRSWAHTLISTLFYILLSAAAMVLLAFDAFPQRTEMFAACFGSLIILLSAMIYVITWTVRRHVLFPVYEDLVRAHLLPTAIPPATSSAHRSTLSSLGHSILPHPDFISSLTLTLPPLPRALPFLSLNHRPVHTTLFHNLDLCARMVRRALAGGVIAAAFWILTERVFCPLWPWQWQWVPGHAAWHVVMCWTFVQLAVVGNYYMIVGDFIGINDEGKDARRVRVVADEWWMRLGLQGIAQYVDVVEPAVE